MPAPGRYHSQGRGLPPWGVVADNGAMTIPELAPRRRYGAIAATWAFALVVAVVIAVVVPLDSHFRWFGLVGGATLIFAFAAQLVDGRPSGFIFRVSVAALGGMTLIGIVALVAVLAAVSPA